LLFLNLNFVSFAVTIIELFFCTAMKSFTDLPGFTAMYSQAQILLVERIPKGASDVTKGSQKLQIAT
jgi:hypothetical protein